MAESDYTVLSSNPVVSGEFTDHGGYIVNVGLRWQSNLQKVPTLTGSKGVPDIPKGQVAVSILVPPTGLSSPMDMTYLDCPVDVYINGQEYDNAFHAGGQIQTKEFGEGIQSLIVSKMYTVLGPAATVT